MPRYRHILIDEAQDLHPSQWRLLRAAVAPGPDDLFIAADPHQRIYDNRVSLASLGISVRGRSRRLSLNYRTTQEILAWAVPVLGEDPVTGLDGEVDSLLGYRSPMHGEPPQLRVAATRGEEFEFLAERIHCVEGGRHRAAGHRRDGPVRQPSSRGTRSAESGRHHDGLAERPRQPAGRPGRRHARD